MPNGFFTNTMDGYAGPCGVRPSGLQAGLLPGRTDFPVRLAPTRPGGHR